MMAIAMLAHPRLDVAIRRNGLRPLRDARASREAISLRTLLRAQSLRGHNGTIGPPPNLRWTLSVASGMLGLREVLAKFIRRRFRDWPLRPRRRVIVLFVLLFTFAAIYLLYEGITSSNYLLVALVIVAYMFILGLEARLSLRPPESTKNSKPAKKSTR